MAERCVNDSLFLRLLRAIGAALLTIFGARPEVRLGSVSTTTVDPPLFSSSFVNSNDTIVTTTIELVIDRIVSMIGCQGK